MDAFDRNAPAEAAELFEDPEWSAVANYRAGAYDESAAALSGIDAPESLYNRGNALAQSGQLADAVAAYDRALELDPGHEDAKYNRELVAALLEQQQQQGDQQDQQGQQGQQEQEQEGTAGAEPGDAGQDGETGQGENESSAGDGADSDGSAGQDPGAEPQSGQEETDGAGGADDSAESPSRDPTDSEEESGETDAEALAAASAEEVEDWASEQAAEQWLRRIAQDPGGLLRRKFLYQYQELGIDHDGNRIAPRDGVRPW
jgi:Ca-activated chloride channel family protein